MSKASKTIAPSKHTKLLVMPTPQTRGQSFDMHLSRYTAEHIALTGSRQRLLDVLREVEETLADVSVRLRAAYVRVHGEDSLRCD